ncbi:DUF4397 domain-containing protein [Tautonia plasticadhaerens]|uniref:PEP-CTERM motif protein n=1 Tax=Tautonia plasticadhaerens TaxID=2527974 RepID=A0A518H0S5_9BACT|nr:DUF4397 domain-containing protein [Tautonia plasticadhaerens]QDV34454.1 PEP-CTERM motif protein [Tautonia plasticadhaerens]
MIRTHSAAVALAMVVLSSPALADVRFFHLSPDTPAVDVLAGASEDTKAPIVEGLSYPNGTGYLPVPTGNYFIDVTPAGMPSMVAIDLNDIALDGATSYTAAAIGTLDDSDDVPLTALLLEDNAVVSDLAQLRIVHASPDAGLVDIFVDGGLALDDFAFGSATGYLGLAAGLYDIEIVQASTGDTLAAFSQLELTSRQVSTAFAIGLVGSTDPDFGFNVLLTNDAAVVPEPGSVAMLSIGIASLAGLALRRRRRRARG